MKPAFLTDQTLQAQYFIFDLNPMPEVEFTVACAGREVCAPDYDLKRSSFRYHAIEFVCAGEAELGLGARSWTLRPGALFSYGPDTHLRIRSRGKQALVKYFVDVAGREAAQRMQGVLIGGDSPLWLSQTRWVHDIFDHLVACSSCSKAEAERLVPPLLELLLQRIQSDARLVRESHSTAFRTYTQCREFIENNFLRLERAEDAATACGLSPEYMTRLFRKFADEAPYRFLVKLRMEYAAELLVREDATVIETAYALGYSDPFHFSRVFKRVHGLAPKTFKSVVRRDR